jgi:uncharacterized protein YhaN
MKIKAIHVEGFGVWSDLRLDDFPDSLTVLYGPNETGKTTLMQFVRSVLFGFSPQRRQRYLPPASGSAAGGGLVVAQHGRSYLLHRGIDQDGFESELRIEPLGGEGDEGKALRATLSAVDEALFNAVFAIGLRDIQELATLGETAAAEFLFRLAAGWDGASIFEVIAELENARNRLLAADDRPCEIVHLLGQRERLQSEIRDLERLLDHYAQALARRREIDVQVERLESQRRELAAESQRLQAAQAVWPAWQRRASLDEELRGLSPPAELPPGALEQFDACGRFLTTARQRLAKYRRWRRALVRRARRVAFNEALWREAAQVEGLCDQAPWIAALEQQLDEATTRRDELAAKLASLGNPRGGSETPSAAGSPASFRRLRQLARKFRPLKQSLREAARKQSQVREALEAVEQQLAAGLAGRGGGELAQAMEQAGNAANGWRRRLQLDRRAEELSSSLKELEAQRLERLERQALPAWILVGMGSIFALGIVVLLAGLVLPLAGSGTWGFALSGLGLVGAMGAVAGKFALEASNHRKLEQCEKQLSVLALQIRQNQQERDQLDQQLPRGGGPITARLQAAEKELAALEELIPLDARRQALARDLASAAEAVAERTKALDFLRRRWRAAVRELGLPGNTSPSQVGRLARRSRDADWVQRQLDAVEQELAGRRAALAPIAERVTPLLALAGAEAAGKQLSRQLDELRERLNQTRQLAETQKHDQQRERLLRARTRKLATAARRARRRRSRLLRQLGAKRASDLQALAAAHARLAQLRQERDQAESEIRAALGSRFTEAEVAALVGKAAETEPFEAQMKQLDARSEAIEKQIQSLREQRGELNARVNNLVGDRRLAEKQLEWSAIAERLRRSVRRWQVLALAWRLLDKLRQEYETRRQPETLRMATDYFERITQGRYRRIWTPLGQRTLMVDDREGRTLAVDLLSEGTREQLFLALRLALVKRYARQGVEMPLILDDLLVNFDAQRARAAALVLRDFAAEGHQVLIFTCHEHLAKLFRSLGLPLRLMPGATLAEEPIEIPVVEVPQVAASATALVAPLEDPPAKQARPVRPPRRKERPLPATTRSLTTASRSDWDAEEFAGEFTERRVEPQPAAVDASDTEAA